MNTTGITAEPMMVITTLTAMTNGRIIRASLGRGNVAMTGTHIERA